MTLVQKIDDVWQPLSGVVSLQQMVSTRTCIYHDGRQAEEPCDPYPVSAQVDIGRAEQLLADGTWTEADLEAYGVKQAAPFTVPDGKRPIGEPRYVEAKGVVSEEYDVEDIPKVEPEPEESKADRLKRMLSDYGLNLGDLKAAMAGTNG